MKHLIPFLLLTACTTTYPGYHDRADYIRHLEAKAMLNDKELWRLQEKLEASEEKVNGLTLTIRVMRTASPMCSAIANSTKKEVNQTKE